MVQDVNLGFPRPVFPPQISGRNYCFRLDVFRHVHSDTGHGTKMLPSSERRTFGHWHLSAWIDLP